MPSPFQQLKNRHKKQAIKPGSLQYNLREVKRDIRKSKRGDETEESMEVMQDAKRRYRKAIKEESKKERDAMLREMDPLQMPREKAKKGPETA